MSSRPAAETGLLLPVFALRRITMPTIRIGFAVKLAGAAVGVSALTVSAFLLVAYLAGAGGPG